MGDRAWKGRGARGDEPAIELVDLLERESLDLGNDKVDKDERNNEASAEDWSLSQRDIEDGFAKDVLSRMRGPISFAMRGEKNPRRKFHSQLDLLSLFKKDRSEECK